METRRLDLDSGTIIVDDNSISEELKKFLDWTREEALYQSKQYDNFDSKDIQKPIWVCKFPPEEFEKTPIWPEVLDNFLNYFEHEAVKLTESYILVSNFGEEHYYHLDPKGVGSSRSITAVIYLNEEWDKNWGGETMFEENDDVVHAVLPKFGRIVYFDHCISHSTRAPNVQCPQRRYVLVLKIQAKG
jgi:Rps23 Pro-64 3,4-dihydroxylase Tpa1-like proline 4-hydroxylase